MKVAFLDRDGTINKDYPDNYWKYVNKPELLNGSISGMKYLNKKGFEIIIITNQYLIGEGIITIEEFYSFHNELLKILNYENIKILDTFFCPHNRNEHCECCKPKTGLIMQAIRKYNDIDLLNSFMCGDSVNDFKCANDVGLKFYGIGFGENKVDTLLDLCNFI